MERIQVEIVQKKLAGVAIRVETVGSFHIHAPCSGSQIQDLAT